MPFFKSRSERNSFGGESNKRRSWEEQRNRYGQLSIQEKFRLDRQNYPESFIEEEPELSDVREVYLNIADFLNLRLPKPEPLLETLNTVHVLCQEEEEKILKDAAPFSNQLEAAKELIKKIDVHYEKVNASTFERTIQIVFLEGINPKRHSAKQAINWDYISQDIREEFLRNNVKEVTFNLFPR